MPQTHIPPQLLQQSDKILIIAHLALGDFTYLQNFLQAFARANPHLKVHLWVDEVRRTSDPAQWKHLGKYSLYDWVAACPFFDKIYTRTYSPALYQESIEEAQREHYPIVVSLATLRPHLYAGLARSISPDGLVIGMKKRVKFYQPHHQLAYRKLNAAIPPYSVDRANPQHISDVYAHWFHQLSGLEVGAGERFPFVDIPPQWHAWSSEQLQQWGVGPQQKLIFVNGFSKAPERSWSLDRILDLARRLQSRPGWEEVHFVVNVVPEALADAERRLAAVQSPRLHLFSADQNFFQLPAMLARCQLVISVETAVMHLANAVHVPVLALMRRTSPEWTPIDQANSTVIWVATPKGGVEEITTEQVIDHLAAWPPVQQLFAA
ncbi:glycosyltransferase family 9 protein [Herbaspirillum huttiense]|uniref:glycosyltransferase family 9 protein n=1 Tax=Herbaspirillum huttiense TaxID=863372 RepID=UPI0004048639|nr:glycosyltransferase family 9 protein [Herbaspirillum huttiense]